MGLINPMLKGFLNSSQIVVYRTSMDGLLDYSMGAIKQNKCFTPTMLWVECSDLSSNFNTERLLLSNESMEKIEMSPTTPLPPVPLHVNLPLKNISFEIEILSDASPITAAHPLYTLVEPLKFKKKDGTYDNLFSIKSIKINIERITNVNVPQNDSFALLKFTAELVPLDASSFFSTSAFKSEAVVLFTPRKLSTHALILSGNMYLTPHTPSANNSVIPTFSSKAESGAGLRFESSVFVNHNVILPPKSSGRIIPVTFLNQVILGRGMLYQSSISDSNLFQPRSSGSLKERYYSQMEDFGGFLRGIEFDPHADGGLTYLFESGAAVEPEDVNMCLARSKALIEKAVTRESRLYAAFRGSAGTPASREHNLLLSLGRINFFTWQSSPSNVEQPLSEDLKYSSPQPSFYPVVNNGSAESPKDRSHFPVARVSVKLTNYFNATWDPAAEFYAAANLSKKGQMTLNIGGGSIVVQLEPSIVSGKSQAHEMKAKIQFNNEPALASFLSDRQVCTCTAAPGSPPPGVPVVTGSCPVGTYQMCTWEAPRVVVDVEAFDVAYRNGNSERLFIGEDRKSSAFHPVFGAHKRHQFVFTRDIGTQDFKILLGPWADNVSVLNWQECLTLPALPYAAPNCVYPTDNSLPMLKQTPYFPLSEVYHLPKTFAEDLESIYENCNVREPTVAGYNPAFGALDWYHSAAADGTTTVAEKQRIIRHSWSFVPGYLPSAAAPGSQEILDDPATPINEAQPGYIDELKLTSTAAKASATEVPVFGVQSRVNRCIVDATANFVAGLFVCNRFIIEARDTPLRIIGTVMTGSLEIDPSAIIQGIRWSSVYTASAMLELQKAGILNSMASCTDPNLPHWMPVKTAAQDDLLSMCLPGSLTQSADPFNWTMADPDCIQDPANAARQLCKKHPRRFTIKEISRSHTP